MPLAVACDRGIERLRLADEVDEAPARRLLPTDTLDTVLAELP
jgi:hypothetical protein